MGSINDKAYYDAILLNQKGIISRLEVVNSKLDKIEKIVTNVNNKVTSNKQENTEEKAEVKRDAYGRVVGLTPEDFYKMHNSGYSHQDIANMTGWSKSCVQKKIRKYKRGEK